MQRNSWMVESSFSIQSVEDCERAIADIFARHMEHAKESAYDVKVCVLAVAMARQEFSKLPVNGTIYKYWADTIARLAAFRDNYDDRDGEYTNGVGVIGSVIESIRALKGKIQT